LRGHRIPFGRGVEIKNPLHLKNAEDGGGSVLANPSPNYYPTELRVSVRRGEVVQDSPYLPVRKQYLWIDNFIIRG
jgi:hypothetical protein